MQKSQNSPRTQATYPTQGIAINVTVSGSRTAAPSQRQVVTAHTPQQPRKQDFDPRFCAELWHEDGA